MENLYTSKFKNYKSFAQFALVAVIFLSATFYSYSQVRVDFEPRTSIYTPSKTIYNVKGDFTMMGNTNLTLVSYGDNTNNGGNDMRYVDIDSDVNTLNSSSAVLELSEENGAIQECSNIVYAGLYWNGRAGSSNTFTVTKNVPTGNTTTQQINTTDVIYDNENIPNTNYSLDISSSGGTYTYTFTPSGAGNVISFIYRTSGNNETLHVSVNSGPETVVPTNSVDDNNAYLSTPYQIHSDANYTLEVTRLRLQWTDRAYVNISYLETVDEYTTITKNYDKRKVSIKGPGAGNYTQLTADANDIYYPTSSDDYMYSAYKEVTDYVKTHGLGNYFVADIALREGDPDGTGYYGGWGMVVVYENTKMKWRDVTVFDGHAYVVSGSNNQYIIDVDGFNAVQSGDVNVKLGVMGGEGDVAFTGDTFQIENRDTNTYTTLSHSGNNTNNFFKSSINTGGNLRNPSLLNNTGIDISMFYINNANKSIIDNQQTSTSFKYFTNGDTYSIHNVTFSVDAYIPETEGLLSLETINGNPAPANPVVTPGDIASYKIEVKNKGSEAIVDGRLVIPIPFTSNYVPGSISTNQYHTLFQSNPPYFDAAEGATGAIIWDMPYIPLNEGTEEEGTLGLNMLLADITFELKATTDCSILINDNCAPKIVLLGGYIEGTGQLSSTDYSLPLIQGYQTNGVCQGEPNADPIEIGIDSEQFILDNCTDASVEREFFYCGSTVNGIPVSEISGNFPPGSVFTNEYPIDSNTEIYDLNNPFPANTGVSTYYAIPPGDSGCNYIFTIEINELVTVPTADNLTYCLNETASPLTATSTDPSYVLLFYTNNDPGAIGQTTLTPNTTTAGTFTYYVSEGPSEACQGDLVAITVEVLEEISITLEDLTPTDCANGNTGAIDISVTGGSGNYTYAWNDAGSSTTQDISGLPAGTYTVLVEDVDSNCSATAEYEITVEDATPPTITAPNNFSIEGCLATDITNGGLTSLPYSETDTAITEAEFLAEGGTFTEDNVTSITYQDNSSGSCPLIITRTFTIVDGCGIAATADQTITINTPALTINEADGAEPVNCLSEATETFTIPTITDACGNNLTPSNAVITDSPDPITCEGTRTYTYTYTDCNNNQDTWSYVYTIEYINLDPIAETTDTADCVANINVPTPPSVTDNCGNDITPVGPVVSDAPACEGEVTYTWTYTDCAGNSQNYVHRVTIDFADLDPIAETTDTADCVANINVPTPPTVTDNCGNDITPVGPVVSDAPACEGEVTYTWTYTDCAGNSQNYVHRVTIDFADLDPIAETTDTVDCVANINVPTPPTVTDNCGNDITPVGPVVSDAPACEGEVTYTWTYTDCAGNSQNYVHRVTIDFADLDPIAETTDTVDCVANINVPTPPSVTDNCGNDITPVGPVVSDAPACEGEVTYTWTYTDCAGNSQNYVHRVTVEFEPF
ncbi:SprB repeat-containing protein, partial [Xanthomarina sp. GH4-25]|uniref:SprB repeat-containing protein n=1 Tax=Xanthomarina sp. GH4-25 TaxID=3349335 RepID=UPI0038780A38